MLNSPSILSATVSGRHELFVISNDSAKEMKNKINLTEIFKKFE